MEDKKKTYQEDKPVVSQIRECGNVVTAITIMAEAIDSLKEKLETFGHSPYSIGEKGISACSTGESKKPTSSPNIGDRASGTIEIHSNDESLKY